jgi:hypothetical protein
MSSGILSNVGTVAQEFRYPARVPKLDLDVLQGSAKTLKIRVILQLPAE